MEEGATARQPSLCSCGAGPRRRCCGSRQRQRLAALCAAGSNGKGTVVVIDNYDSFTYNLCQVCFRRGALCKHLPRCPVPSMLLARSACTAWLRGRADGTALRRSTWETSAVSMWYLRTMRRRWKR